MQPGVEYTYAGSPAADVVNAYVLQIAKSHLVKNRTHSSHRGQKLKIGL